LINMGHLKIAVSTDGASPTIGQEVRDFIQRVIPKEVSSLLEIKSLERKNKIINVQKTKKQIKKILGKVYLIGCGIGDVELLTIKAYNLILQMDVVFIDHLISGEVLEIIPNSTKQIYIGKQKGKLITSQEEINHLLLEYANKGLRVARLKSGDPYIFGRGAEEAIFLAKNDIEVEVSDMSSMPSFEIPGMPGANVGMINISEMLGKNTLRLVYMKASYKNVKETLSLLSRVMINFGGKSKFLGVL